MKLLEEISKASRGTKLREDNILFMFSTRLKQIANDLGVFILSSTQVNGGYKDAKDADENLLRGALVPYYILSYFINRGLQHKQKIIVG